MSVKMRFQCISKTLFKHPCGVCRKGSRKQLNLVWSVSGGFIKDVVASRGS